ncbi:hypothetical protein FHR85_000301 [Alkalibacillus almallahensis]|nr:hypothetical protein [Alkalibacillus almallahensis]
MINVNTNESLYIYTPISISTKSREELYIYTPIKNIKK